MIKASAYAAATPKALLAPTIIERREPRPNDIVVDIHFCGICHSDIHQARGEWGEGSFPMVPGHEIVGVVSRIGSAVKKWKVGDKVGVGCMVDSCRECSACRSHEEQFCEKGPSFTYNSVEQDRKTPTQGGYSSAITVSEDFVLRLPAGLAMDAAAPLLCAGITTYSPLKRHDVKKGDEVAILGLGGLGHMGVKIAKAMGARVTVLSHSPNKKKDALALGADDFISTKEPDAFDKNLERFDFILDTVAAPHDYNAYLRLLKRDRSMVLVGIPGPTTIEASVLVMKRRSLKGSLIGGIKETQEMLDFCASHGIAAEIEVIAPEAINEAFERTIRSDVHYRFVIRWPRDLR